MTTPELQVVVGAAGVTGRRVVQHLLDAGHPVRAVTRDGRSWPVEGAGQPEWAAADATDPEALTAVCRGAGAVYHCVMPPLLRWQADFPPVTDALVAAAGRADARLVYADDTWMYGRVSGPMTPDTAGRPVSSRGVLRAWLAERILRAGEGGRLPVSVVRAGELYGHGVRSMIAGNVFGAARQGRAAHWFGDPDLPITPTLVDDFAATLVAVGTGDTGAAAVWHVPHPAPTTGRALAAEAFRQAGHPVRLHRHGARQLRVLGLASPVARAGAELVYQFEQPFVVDGTATRDRFGVQPTSYRDGVAAALGLAPVGPGSRS